MLSASIVVVNQWGTGAGGKNSSPAMPRSTNAHRNPMNQRIACRTSRKTSAPSGARIPHSPTPPAGRKPPANICPTVVVRRMSRSCVVRNGLNRLVLAKISSDPSDTAK